MSDLPPTSQPPEEPAGTESDAVEAAQARDHIEEAARAVFTAALIWYALHGDEDPGAEALFTKTARRLATIMWRMRPRLSASKVPKTTPAERDAWIEQQTDRIVTATMDDAAAHYDTVFKRIRRADPKAADSKVRSEYRLDHAWAGAAARSAATRLAAETAMGLREDVEGLTGERHSLMWISRGDPKVRKLHRSLHGKVRPPGDPFYTWPDGATLNYPGDPTAPIDAWINCRCGLLLVPSKDAAHAEDVFHVPDADFDVPLVATGDRSPDIQRAEADLRGEKTRRYIAT